MNELIKKWKDLCTKMNKHGIPLPMIRDPKKGQGSVSLTLVFISFNVWLVSMIGHAAGALGGMDHDAALQMFLASAGLYWSRKLTKDEKSIELAEEQYETLEKNQKSI